MSDIATTVGAAGIPAWIYRKVDLRRCTLEVMNGNDQGKRFGPLGEQTTIGRELFCDIGLTDERVSKVHCELKLTPDGLRVRDLDSLNGVWIGPNRLFDMEIRGNDEIRIGTTRVRIFFEQGTTSCETPTVDSTGTLVVGTSSAMGQLYRTLQRIAPGERSVLLLGETGTGKTTVARALHAMSRRKDRPFLDINCATIAPSLVENELFGHVRGAFTGADSDREGLFQQAAGGTLLLDEIGEMSPDLQAKLLKVLDTRSVRPLGGQRDVPVDFRLVCATNRDLRRDIDSGRFRRDLYYRIAGMELSVPPLRERVEDIGMIAEWLTMKLSDAVRASGLENHVGMITPEAIRVLERHPWPGNVRELENVIANAVDQNSHTGIQPEHIILSDRWEEGEKGHTPTPEAREAVYRGKATSFEDFEATVLGDYFKRLMEDTSGNISRAAVVSGLSRPTVRKRLNKYGLLSQIRMP